MNNSQFEDLLGYRFKDKNLLDMALTHSSYNMDKKVKQADNERLEFLGDAFLDTIISVELYKRMSDVSEGKLTKTRAVLVCEKSLATLAKKYKLGKYINMGYGESMAGGRHKDSILSDTVEAVIGAIYLDGGYEVVSRIVVSAFKELIPLAISEKLYMDYKSELQETLQSKEGNVSISYVTDKEEGPAHDRRFVVHVEYGGKIQGKGKGKSKKEAEKNAAKDALMAIKKESKGEEGCTLKE